MKFLGVWLLCLAAAPLFSQVPFINLPLVTASVGPGGAGFILTVNGGNYTPSAVVRWNGQALPTTYVSVTRLIATVPATDIARRGTATITVSNPTGASSLATLLPIVAATTKLSFEQSSVIAGTSPVTVTVADFNQDGAADLAFINEAASEADPTLVSVYLGSGDGTFTLSSTINVVGFGGSVLTGDFNRDGKVDLAFSSAPGSAQTTLSVALGNGDGTFQPPSYLYVSESDYQFAIGDFNRDGNLDLANIDLSNFGSVGVYLGNGDGNFTGGWGEMLYLKQNDILAGDFNNDGILDLAIPSLPTILIGNGDGTFIVPPIDPAVPINDISAYLGFLVADINGDGLQDIVFPNTPSLVYLGNGNGTFTQPAQPNPFNSGFLVSADFNGDGKLDLASIDGLTDVVSILLGNGDGTFQAPLTLPVSGVPSSIALGDFNNDGLLDLAYTNSNNEVGILLNTSETSKVVLSPASLAFPQQVLFTNSQPLISTLANAGSEPLNIASISASGPFSEKSTCGNVLSPGASCSISVIFHPSGIGRRGGSIVITDNATHTPHTVSLIGIGTYIQFSPDGLHFGNQPVGKSTVPKNVTVSNKGEVAVGISNISIVGSDAEDFQQTNTCGDTLAPRASCLVTVIFTPSSKGVKEANLYIVDDAGGSPQTTILRGVGTE
jgi:hypothetical protein